MMKIKKNPSGDYYIVSRKIGFIWFDLPEYYYTFEDANRAMIRYMIKHNRKWFAFKKKLPDLIIDIFAGMMIFIILTAFFRFAWAYFFN